MNTLRFTEKLFSYGTLQLETVQLTLFGRKLNGTPDILSGYHLSTLQINDLNVVAVSGVAAHPILIYMGKQTDQIKGTVFEITAKELQLADEYEVASYKRVRVQLHSNLHAWVYVSAESEITCA